MAGGGRFWAFSLTVYARPGVAEACLRLQEARDLDVNLLLHALWCGALGHRITLPERGGLDEAVASWHAEAVRPLRAVRRWLKTQETLSAAEAEALRAGVKAQELEAERLEQGLLEGLLAPPPRPGGPAHAAANLLALVPVPNEAERGDLAVLLRGAWPDAERDDLAALFEASAGHWRA